MKRLLLFLAFFADSRDIHAQDFNVLLEHGKHREIIQIYEASPGTFDKNKLETVAAAYDRLGRLEDEEKVIHRIVSSLPLFLTYGMPSAYSYYGRFINAGLMEKYGNWIGSQYQRSVRDTSLGIEILNAFYRDQGVREKYVSNEYCRKNGEKMAWDSVRLMKQWKQIDSSNAILIARIIRDHGGFPSRKDIGLIGTQSLFIMMQHLNAGYRERYDRYLLDAACKEDISMADYAMYRTRTLLLTDQIPGSRLQHTLDSLSGIKCP